MIISGAAGFFISAIGNSGRSEKFRYKITEKGIRLTQISKEIENRVGLD